MTFSKCIVVVLVLSTVVRFSDASLPQLSFDHRLSSKLKEKSLREGSAWPFPEPKTAGYHQLLRDSDVARTTRMLATITPSSLTFSEGNYSAISPLGSIYYATVDVGTPSVPFFVALDTGSDLFWLPCECKACAPSSSPSYPISQAFKAYAPSLSTTSSEVTCASADCSVDFSQCAADNIQGTGQCAYTVVYGSPNTSTSGVVVKDVLHLTPNEGTGPDVTSPIVLGCGQTQTGYLVDGSSGPDGLIGLGLRSYSVPSYLASAGLVGNSFSMCFDADGSGRIVFGDFGSSTLATTPFQTPLATTPGGYFVQVDSITVGQGIIPVGQIVLFDSGTAYTTLETSVYKALLTQFAANVAYPKVVFDGLFDLCYESSDEVNVDVPLVEFNLDGGSKFAINGDLAFYFYTNNTQAGFCLGAFDGGDQSIFGANFMYGYNIVFNREMMTLGFEEANCYETKSYSSSGSQGPEISPSSSPAPSPANSKPPAPTAGASVAPTTPTIPTAPTPAADSAATTPSFSLLTLLSLSFVSFLLIKIH